MLEKQASNNSCATQQGEFYITSICGPQKGWRLSPVINLKVLNLLVVEEHFKVEGFHMVKDLVENKDWMTKIDMKDAHFLVPIHPTHQKLLQFQWMGTTYQFCCLPFGLPCAPYIYKTDETCSGFLETERHQADYIPRRPDHFLQQSGDAHTSTDINTGVAPLIGLNYQIKEVTTQQIVYLGLTISTISMTVSLPKEKLTKLKQKAKNLLLKSKVTVQRLVALWE